MENATGNFTVLLIFQHFLNLFVYDIFIGEQIATEGEVSWLGCELLQARDVGSVGSEAKREPFTAHVGVVAFQALVGDWETVKSFHGFFSALMFFVLHEAVAFRLSSFSD